MITMSAHPSNENDFDFVIGQWRVEHKRLKEYFTGCAQWYKFSGTSTTRKILGGNGNIEDNVLVFLMGKPELRQFVLLILQRDNGLFGGLTCVIQVRWMYLSLAIFLMVKGYFTLTISLRVLP